jgi:hypothetical protein
MPPIVKTVVGVFAGLLAVFGILAVIRRQTPDLGSVSGSWITEYHRATMESYDS